MSVPSVLVGGGELEGHLGDARGVLILALQLDLPIRWLASHKAD